MKEITRKRILQGAVVVGLLSLTGHFLLTACYLAPESVVPTKALYLSKGYMVPMFHQRLKVFAPEPPSDSPHLQFRCTFSDSTTSSWIDPGTALLKKHHQYRISNYQKRYRMYEGVANNLAGMHYRLTWKKPAGYGFTSEFEQEVREHICYQLAQRYLRKQAAALFPDRQLLQIELRTFRAILTQAEDPPTTDYPAFSP